VVQTFFKWSAAVIVGVALTSCTTVHKQPDSDEVLMRLQSSTPYHCLVERGTHCILRAPKDFSEGIGI